MADRDPDQPGRRRHAPRLAGRLWFTVAALVLAGCSNGGEPRVAVTDLNWACGTERCTASFRLAAQSDSESLLVLVRAYAGERVAEREIVGEHREHLTLGAGQSRRLSVSVETRKPAHRVRVVVQRAE